MQVPEQDTEKSTRHDEPRNASILAMREREINRRGFTKSIFLWDTYSSKPIQHKNTPVANHQGTKSNSIAIEACDNLNEQENTAPATTMARQFNKSRKQIRICGMQFSPEVGQGFEGQVPSQLAIVTAR
jgi:hypothetical protein